AVLLAVRDTEADELADRAGGQAVAADLVAGEGRLLQQQHVQPVPRQVGGRRRPAGARPDDDDVCRLDLLTHVCYASLVTTFTNSTSLVATPGCPCQAPPGRN